MYNNDYDEEDMPDSQIVNELPSYTSMTKKQYFKVNFAKFVIECYGVFAITTFYLMMGDQEAGMFLGIWVLMIFGNPISGSHFNPVVTIGQMFRRDESGMEKQLGVIYIAGQIAGGILGGLAGLFLVEKASPNAPWNATVMPMTYVIEKTETEIITENISFGAIISEFTGAFIIALMTMIMLNKKQEFSEDKNIIQLTKSAIVITGRLMAGSILVTGLPQKMIEAGTILKEDGSHEIILIQDFKEIGPLLNPAIGLGLMVTSMDFFYVIQYLVMPLAGGICALIFHEFIYMKTLDILENAHVHEIQKIYSSDGEEAASDANGYVQNQKGSLMAEDC